MTHTTYVIRDINMEAGHDKLILGCVLIYKYIRCPRPLSFKGFATVEPSPRPLFLKYIFGPSTHAYAALS